MDHVLIVDDNDTFRSILKQVLLSRFPSMHISEAQDGDSAMEKIEEQSPDVILMDVRLPGEGGFQLTRRVKAAHSKIAIIIVTSYDSPEYREAAFDSGADYFFSKTSSTAMDVLEKVDSILSSP